MEYSEERLVDLMKEYDKYLASVSNISMPDVYNHLANVPSRRFWVSDTRAAVVIRSIEAGSDILNSMWPTKREMYEEIHRRVKALRARVNKPLIELCAAVVIQPAPKFYLSADSIKIMVCKARKEWQKRKMLKLYRSL